jgi:hypothetical protein
VTVKNIFLPVCFSVITFLYHTLLAARGVLTSVPDQARKLRRYINAYSANARPIQWKYSDPSRRIRTNDFTATVHLVVIVK